MARERVAPPDELTFKPRDRETVSFEVITPLFGGGVHIAKENAHLKEPDRVTPVRTASIRGQLRFWWRAAWGCQFERAQMYAQEAEIWGRAAITRKIGDKEVTVGPGKVALRLESAARISGAEAGIGQGVARAYGAFPLQAAREATLKDPGRLTRLSGDTRLVLTFTNLSETQKRGVQHAIQAWLMFGGLGGRTRRGFGAVHPVGSQNPAQVLRALQQGLENRAGVPSLVGATLAVRPVGQPTGLGALDLGLDRLRLFRQGENFGRNKGSQSRPGRSRWPEPDAIRRITRSTTSRHSIPETRADAFPRAAFGMPVIFHFKMGDGDPSDTTLQPRGAERLASPLIIRPFRNTQSKYDVLALRLGGPAAGPVELKLGRSRGEPVRTTITAAELATDLSKLNGILRNQPDVLAAFLAFFQQ